MSSNQDSSSPEAATPPEASAADIGGRLGIEYDGQPGKLFGMGFSVAFLSLLTLGFYRFWGKTRIRRYLWSRISLGDSRLEYTGTGKELFLGFLVALTVLVPLGAASYAVEFFLVGEPGAYVAATLVQYVVIMFLIGYATFRARRYRLSRTVLRGIRFWQTGSNVGYALRWMGYFAITAATLGIARPVGDVALYRYRTGHTWFGSRNFEAFGNTGRLMGPWIACLMLAPFTLGLSLLWYSAFKIRYLTGSTRYQDLSLSLPISFRNLFGIYLPYYLAMMALLALVYAAIFAGALSSLIQGGEADAKIWLDETAMFVTGVGTMAAVLTFGLISPILNLVMVTHRMMRLTARKLAFEGDIDPTSVMQIAAAQPTHGEGLADALDIGGGLEVGL